MMGFLRSETFSQRYYTFSQSIYILIELDDYYAHYVYFPSIVKGIKINKISLTNDIILEDNNISLFRIEANENFINMMLSKNKEVYDLCEQIILNNTLDKNLLINNNSEFREIIKKEYDYFISHFIG